MDEMPKLILLQSLNFHFIALLATLKLIILEILGNNKTQGDSNLSSFSYCNVITKLFILVCIGFLYHSIAEFDILIKFYKCILRR